MKLYKRNIVLLFIYAVAFFLKGNSQNISGDTIFINRSLTYTIVLPTVPTSFSTIPDNTSYKIKPEKSFIVVTTEKEIFSPAILKISEGGRVHNFTIIYKKEIDFSDPNIGIKDYPTIKKLKARFNELALQNSASEEQKQILIMQKDSIEKSTTESGSAKVIEAKETYQGDNELLNKNYEASVALADKLFKSGDYVHSRVAYKTALGFIKKEYPENQISIIDKFIADRFNKEKENEQILAKAENVAKQYATLIRKADLEFEKGDFSKAKIIYKEASDLKPSEEYIKKKLEYIDITVAKNATEVKAKRDSIEMQKKADKRYNQALKQGKAYRSKNDLGKAKKAYEDARKLKPLENEPYKQLEIINGILADITRKEESDRNYILKISIADSLSKVELYDSALKAYKEAQVIKPAELYAIRQIKAMQDQLARIKQIDENNKRKEAQRDYDKAISNANSFYSNKNNYYSKAEFLKAESIHPLSNTDQQRFNNLLYQIEKYQKDSLSKIPVIDTIPKKSKRKKSFKRKGKNNNTFNNWQKPLKHDIDIQVNFSFCALQERMTC